MTNNRNPYPYILLFVQPIFMATNIIVARGGVEYVPPISLAFWRWLTVFLIGLATTLTKSMMIGFKDVLPVYILMGIVIAMMFYEAFGDKK